MRLLTKLKDKAEILLCIHAGAIERKKMRADFGITYDADAMKLIDDLREWGIELRAVVITRFDGQPAAVQFSNKLERRGIPVYTHRPTKGYPTEVDRIVSPEGYGANPYIETEKPLVVVTGPGPGQRQAGHLPEPDLPRPPPRHPFGLREVRDVSDLESAADASGERGLRGGHRRPARREHDRPVPPGGLRPDGHQLQPRRRGVPGPAQDPRADHRRRSRSTARRRKWASIGASAGIVDDDGRPGGLPSRGDPPLLPLLLRVRHGVADERDGAAGRAAAWKCSHIKPEDRTVVGPARQAAEEAQQQGKGNEGVYCGAAIELHDGTHRHRQELAADARRLQPGADRWPIHRGVSTPAMRKKFARSLLPSWCCWS